jgi:hypothetical protein
MFALIYKIEKKEFHVGTYNFGFFSGWRQGDSTPPKTIDQPFLVLKRI